MSHLVLFHNPRCSKSRQTLALVRERGLEPEIRLYLEHPAEPDELRGLLRMLGMKPRDLLRRGEPEYRALSLADPGLDDAAILKAMHQHPRLMERPILVVDGARAALGRPPESVLAILPDAGAEQIKPQ